VQSLPHVVMGLHYGELRGEETALRIVAAHAVAGLVLVALMPLLGTAMERVAPPATDELVRCMHRARELMPGRRLLLGCARPGGEAKVALDRTAIDLRFDAIAFPADGTVALASDAGREPRFHETCCGVPWLFDGGAA